MSQSADIVFVPYNYVVDDNMRQSLGIDWYVASVAYILRHAADVPALHSSRTSAVVIFDEAHNLASICQSFVNQFLECYAF